jgi:hypothetical protein
LVSHIHLCATIITHIELSIGGPVTEALSFALDLAHGGVGEAVPHGTAHYAQALDVGGQVGVLLEQQANVGQGARGDQPGRVGRRRNEGAVHGLEVVDVGRGELGGLWQQGHAIEAALAVDVSGMDCVADNGLRSARVDLHIASSYGLEYGACVEGGLVEGRIAVDGAHAEELDARVVGREEEGVCVLQSTVSKRAGLSVANASYIVAGVLGGVNTGAGRGAGAGGYGHSRARAGLSSKTCLNNPKAILYLD